MSGISFQVSMQRLEHVCIVRVMTLHCTDSAQSTYQEEQLGCCEQLDRHTHALPLPARDALAAGVADDDVLYVADAHQLDHVGLTLGGWMGGVRG